VAVNLLKYLDAKGRYRSGTICFLLLIFNQSGWEMKLRHIALLLLALPASTSFGQYPTHNRDRGLIVGGLLGAVTGGAIGENNDEPAAGAAIGAAVGALTGAAFGDSVDNEIAWRQAAQQQRMAYQAAKAVQIHDVIAMSQAGLSDSVIVSHIHANGVAARPQPTELITMSRAGVSEAVMHAMQTARLASAQPMPPVYRDRVIVEEHHYVAPRYPRYHHWHYHHVHPHYYRPGVHWQFSFGD
jgi:hypothetical protein